MNTLIEPSPLLSANLLAFTRPSPLSLPPEPGHGPGKCPTRKIRILVAEDDGISRELICARLAKWNYEVIVASNGTEAMAELRKKDAPVLAILDWMMPGMDGIEICRRVREADRVLYVILLTARGGTESIVEGLGAGADDYLIKPVERDELKARILVGLRVMALQSSLADRLKDLEAAKEDIRKMKLDLVI